MNQQLSLSSTKSVRFVLVGLTVLLVSFFVGVMIARMAPGSVLSYVKIESNTPNLSTLAANDAFGEDVVSIGDLDGDGVTELAVGMHRYDDGGASTANYGSVYILFMNTDGSLKDSSLITRSTVGFRGVGDTPLLDTGDLFGVSVEAIGDFNGDTIPDIAVGATSDDGAGNAFNGGGAIYLVYLTAEGGVSGYKYISIGETAIGAGTGSSNGGIAYMGDLLGNGGLVLASGVYNSNAVHLLYLDSNGDVALVSKIDDTTEPFAGALSEYNSGSDLFGAEVSNIGDVNGDGVDDLAVGSYYDDIEGGPGNAGAVYIFFMETDGYFSTYSKIGTEDALFANIPVSSYFGSSIDDLGDIDGDGFNEYAIGSEGYSGGTGMVYIVTIGADGEAVEIDMELKSGENGTPTLNAADGFAWRLANIGDLDGDGVTDLAVGAYKADYEALLSTGAVYILFLEGGTATADSGSSTGAKPQAFRVNVAGDAWCSRERDIWLEFTGRNIQTISYSTDYRFYGAETVRFMPGNGAGVLPDYITPNPDAFYAPVQLDDWEGIQLVYAIARSPSGNRSDIEYDFVEYSLSDLCYFPPEENVVEEDPLANIQVGDVIAEDVEGATVYYVDEINGSLIRRPYVTDEILASWYIDEDEDVEVVTFEQLMLLPIGEPMLPQGPTIVRFDHLPHVYYVTSEQELRKITTPFLEMYLFGGGWARNVEELPISLLSEVTQGRLLTRYDAGVYLEWKNARK